MRFNETRYNRLHIAEEDVWNVDEWIIDRNGNMVHAEELRD